MLHYELAAKIRLFCHERAEKRPNFLSSCVGASSSLFNGETYADLQLADKKNMRICDLQPGAQKKFADM
jgi:hypothetical protein